MEDKKIEMQEARRLARKAFKFTISYRETRRDGLFGIFGKKVTEDRTEELEISEPTLAVLDHMSSYWINIEVDDKLFANGGADTLLAARKLVNEKARDLAMVVAIAVLGEDYYIKTPTFKVKEDDKTLYALRDRLFHCVKPDDLLKIAQIITASCNLGDFIGSMRLMSASRTTQPTSRIE